MEEELVPVRPVSDIPDEGETLRESASVAQISKTEAEPELESVPMPDIKELEEGLPPEEGEEERAGHVLFARVRPLILDGEDLDLPPALRKRKPDPSSMKSHFPAVATAKARYSPILGFQVM